jgi:hypothetical protein
MTEPPSKQAKACHGQPVVLWDLPVQNVVQFIEARDLVSLSSVSKQSIQAFEPHCKLAYLAIKATQPAAFEKHLFTFMNNTQQLQQEKSCRDMLSNSLYLMPLKCLWENDRFDLILLSPEETKCLVSTSDRKFFHLFDAKTLECITTVFAEHLVGHGQRFELLHFLNEDQVLCATLEAGLFLWDLRKVLLPKMQDDKDDDRTLVEPSSGVIYMVDVHRKNSHQFYFIQDHNLTQYVCLYDVKTMSCETIYHSMGMRRIVGSFHDRRFLVLIHCDNLLVMKVEAYEIVASVPVWVDCQLVSMDHEEPGTFHTFYKDQLATEYKMDPDTGALSSRSPPYYLPHKCRMFPNVMPYYVVDVENKWWCSSSEDCIATVLYSYPQNCLESQSPNHHHRDIPPSASVARQTWFVKPLKTCLSPKNNLWYIVKADGGIHVYRHNK